MFTGMFNAPTTGWVVSSFEVRKIAIGRLGATAAEEIKGTSATTLLVDFVTGAQLKEGSVVCVLRFADPAYAEADFNVVSFSVAGNPLEALDATLRFAMRTLEPIQMLVLLLCWWFESDTDRAIRAELKRRERGG